MEYARINPDYNVSLMASAGTGKTYNLALRAVITLLKRKAMKIQSNSYFFNQRVSSYSGRVLCLTFTKKATAEMYDRIDELLHRLYDKSIIDMPEYDEITKLTCLDIDELQIIAGEVLDSLSIDPDMLQIKTIDSFFYMILSLFAFEANVSPNFSIVDSVYEAEYFNISLQRVFSFLNNDNRYFELLSKYIRELSIKPYDFIDTLKSNLTIMLSDSMILTSEIKNYHDITIEDLSTILEDISRHGDQIRITLSEMISIVSLNDSYCSTRFLNYKEKFIDVINGGNIVAISDKFKYFSPSKVYTKKYVTYLNTEYYELYEKLEKITDYYLSSLYKLDKVLLVHIYSIFEYYLKVIKNYNKVFSYSDITKAVYSLLNPENDLALDSIKNYIYFRLDGKIEHILIDEFQDTSLVQWYILKPLIDEAVSGSTQYGKVGSFFCVGDPKQNIYRFRGSNPVFFGAINKIYADKLKVETLCVNYRSDRNIVEFVNNLFNDAEIKVDNLFSDSNKLTHKFIHMRMFGELFQTVNSLEDGYVKVVPIEAEPKSLQDRRIVHLIDAVNSLKNNGYTEIAILVRKRSDGRYAKNHLLRNNISAYTTFSENLYTRNAYIILRSLVSYMISSDRYSLISFLVTEPSIIPIEDLINPERLDMLKTKLDFSLNKSIGVPVYKRILLLDAEFSLFYRLNNDKDFYASISIIASSLFDIVNPFIFLNKLDNIAKSIKQESFGGGVKISTVHSSKGLQFESVILFNVSQSFKLSQGDYFLSEYIENDNVDISLNKSSISPKPLIEYEKMMKRYDCINMLYVACTRAKKAMYIFVNKKAEKYSTEGYILNLFPSGIEQGVLSGKKDIENDICNKPYISHNSNFYVDPKIDMNVVEAHKDFKSDIPITYESFLDRIFGTIIHKAIYYLNSCSEIDVIRAIDKVRTRQKPYANNSMFMAIERYINLLVTSEFWKTLSGYTMYQERAVSFKGEVFIIDAYFMNKNKNEIILVDFKTSDPDGERRDEYAEKILLYAYILKSKYRSNIRSYLIYFYNNMTIIEVT